MTDETGWLDARSQDIATHRAPVWRDRADFIVLVDLTDYELPGKWEQLWARRLGEREFELCCIPFFADGMTLGDVVEALPAPWRVQRVVRKSGRHLLRAAFASRTDPPEELHEQLHGALLQLGVLHEWRASGYVACSPGDDAELAALAALLRPHEARGELVTECDP